MCIQFNRNLKYLKNCYFILKINLEKCITNAIVIIYVKNSTITYTNFFNQK